MLLSMLEQDSCVHVQMHTARLCSSISADFRAYPSRIRSFYAFLEARAGVECMFYCTIRTQNYIVPKSKVRDPS